MEQGKYDLSLYRGDTYSRGFRFWEDQPGGTAFDLTGATAEAEFRDKPGGASVIQFTCAITLPNTITIHLVPAQWAYAPAKKGYWDLEVTFSPTEVYTLIAGDVIVTQDVTNSSVDVP
jgi:hypothetical protein